MYIPVFTCFRLAIIGCVNSMASLLASGLPAFGMIEFLDVQKF